MIKIRSFNIADLYFIDVQENQKHETGLYSPSNPSLEAFTIYEDSINKILAILLFTPIDEERCVLGALLSSISGQYFLGMRNIIFNFLKLYNYARLECTVKEDFKNGHRLMTLLGFVKEGTMRKYHNNETYCLYGRIK